MKILILGAGGQLGQALIQQVSEKNTEFLALRRADFSITESLEQLKKQLGGFEPQVIFNCAAYTQVDLAEKESDKAFLINGKAMESLSLISNHLQAKLIHISTDFVFDGQKAEPYIEEDSTNPLSVYGQSKLMGEKAVQEMANDYAIFRTSWLYSKNSPCFYTTMLRLAETKKELSIVSDQQGGPTNVNDLVQALLEFVNQYGGQKTQEVFHFSNEGETSWYGFAQEIFRLNNVSIEVSPIPTSGYPTPATRPAYSVMSTAKYEKWVGKKPPHWQESLKELAL